MLLERIEGHSHHVFFDSGIGVSDWITRSDALHHDLQITSAHQNNGLLVKLETDVPCKMIPSMSGTAYQEKLQRHGSLCFHINGRFQLATASPTTLRLTRMLLSSMRFIRILQEGGEQAYQSIHNTGFNDEVSTQIIKDGALSIKRNSREVYDFSAILKVLKDERKSIPVRIESGIPVIRVDEGLYNIEIDFRCEGGDLPENLCSFANSPELLLNEDCKSILKGIDSPLRQQVFSQLTALSFLCRKTKMLAGAPRFMTYFGRDTLISVSLLAGIARDDLTLAGLFSVIERLSSAGEVAHEEALGEFSFVSDESASYVPLGPRLDYLMVDDNFLLPAVLFRWIEFESPGRIVSALKINNHHYAERIVQNLQFCMGSMLKGLIPYKEGCVVGDWRDSLSTIGVCYSYELNLGIVPGFMKAFSSIYQALSEIIVPRATFPESNDQTLIHERFMNETVRFVVRTKIPSMEYFSKYLDVAGFFGSEHKFYQDIASKFYASHDCFDYTFYALALDSRKNPLPVQHNDVAFSFLFTEPNLDMLDIMLRPLETPFPVGLRTSLGILVTNPIFSTVEEVRRNLDRSHYHGLVIWPLMHHLLYHGLLRQLGILRDQCSPMSEKLIFRMRKLLVWLDELRDVLKEFDASELFTFRIEKGVEVPVPFGKAVGSSTESNPIQLWSSLGFTTLFASLKQGGNWSKKD